MGTTNPRFANGHRRRKARRQLIAASDGICPLCGRPMDLSMPPSMHMSPYYPVIDEKVPISKGGTLSIDNQWLVHRRCNAIKGAKLLGELNHDAKGAPSQVSTTRDWGITL